MKVKPTYTVSDDTHLYLDALNIFQEFKNALIYAVSTDYTDEMANDLVVRHGELFNSVEGIIWDYMKPHVTERMGMDTDNVEI